MLLSCKSFSKRWVRIHPGDVTLCRRNQTHSLSERACGLACRSRHTTRVQTWPGRRHIQVRGNRAAMAKWQIIRHRRHRPQSLIGGDEERSDGRFFPLGTSIPRVRFHAQQSPNSIYGVANLAAGSHSYITAAVPSVPLLWNQSVTTGISVQQSSLLSPSVPPPSLAPHRARTPECAEHAWAMRTQ